MKHVLFLEHSKYRQNKTRTHFNCGTKFLVLTHFMGEFSMQNLEFLIPESF